MAEDVKITIRAFDKTQKAFGGVTSGLKGIAKAVFSAKTAVAGLAGIAGIGFLIKQSLAASDQLSKTAQKIGTTTEALSALQYAAKITGVEANTLNMAMQRFTRRTAEAANGTGEAKNALRELGLDAEALVQMPLDQRMITLAKAFSVARPEAEKLALAFKLFDSEGAALINTLNLGEEGLRELMQEAETLGLVLDQQAATGIEKANDAMFKFFSITRGLIMQLTAGLAPALELIATELKENTLESIEEAGGSVKEFGKQLAISFITTIGQSISALGQLVRGITDFMKGALEMVNWARDWMGLSEITVDLNYDLANSIEDFGARVWSAGYGLKFLNDKVDETNKKAGEAPNIFQKWGASITDVASKMPSLREQMDSVGKTLESSLTQGFTDAITGAKSFGDAMKNMARLVVDALMKMFVQYMIVQPMLNALGGALGLPTTTSPTGKAIGGSVQSGQPYMVGERGPEMFVPNQSGSIVSNGNMGGGSGVVVNQTINVTTGIQSTVRAEIASLMPQIAQAAKGAVADARVRGGNFSRAMVGA